MLLLLGPHCEIYSPCPFLNRMKKKKEKKPRTQDITLITCVYQLLLDYSQNNLVTHKSKCRLSGQTPGNLVYRNHQEAQNCLGNTLLLTLPCLTHPEPTVSLALSPTPVVSLHKTTGILNACDRALKSNLKDPIKCRWIFQTLSFQKYGITHVTFMFHICV